MRAHEHHALPTLHATTCTEPCFWSTLAIRLTSTSKSGCTCDFMDSAPSCPMAKPTSHHCRWGRAGTRRPRGWGHRPFAHRAVQAVVFTQTKAIPVSLLMRYHVCFQWLPAALFPVISCKAGRATSPGWRGGEEVCGQPPPPTAAAVGDNGAWQSCALRANAVSIGKGLSNLGRPKADPQAEEEEDLQCGSSSGLVCGVDQGRYLCGTSTGPALACATFPMAWGSPWGALLGHPKGPPDVAPGAQQRQSTTGDLPCSG